jgi:vacuolar-type H+-ATPase subunit I/STV1
MHAQHEDSVMSMVRFRLIGNREDADAVITALHGISDIEHVEEIDDMMPGMRDDSSSSESVSDSEGRVYCIEVDTPNDSLADTVRGSAEVIANDRNAGIEFVDEF